MEIHNVVNRATLLRNGTASATIQRNVRQGAWHRTRSGIYVTGPGDPAKPWLQPLASEVLNENASKVILLQKRPQSATARTLNPR